MLNRILIVFIVWGWSIALHAESYLVLFKSNQSPNHGKAAHKQQMENKKQLNSERIEKLLQALGVNKSEVNYQDLWLIAGLEMQLKPEDLSQVQKLDFVDRVIVNRVRQYITPDLRAAAAPDKDWGLQRLAIPKLRAEFPAADGLGVRVGILDTGIQSRHPEFYRKNTVVFRDFVNGIIYPYDDNGHGTHVAGTIAGASTGLAPKVDLYVAKAFSATGSASYDSLVKAMQWLYDPDGDPATEDSPQVVNNSWGLDLPFAVNDLSEFEIFHRAILAWGDSNIIPVFAAGNSGSAPNGMPGGLAEVLSVGAIDVANKIADFSSRGPNFWKIGNQVTTLFKPDFSAPGVDIYSAWPGNGYEYLSGTSMATPHVVGSIALVLQKTGRVSTGDMKTILLYSMEPKLDFDFGSGIVNPLQALRQLSQETPPIVAKFKR